MLEEVLSAQGHQPTSYAHAGLALGAIARGQFELLLCDVMLPNVNGLDAMRMARSQFPYLPIIAISALEEDKYREQALEAGASCYLQKPLRMDRLLQEVELVQRSQVDLTVAVIDPDTRHKESVTQDLTALGCVVHAFNDLHTFRSSPVAQQARVLLVDSSSEDLESGLRWAAQHDLAAVPFWNEGDRVNEDHLMRSGASFCATKPIDTLALVTQARFFVSPSPMA